MMRTVMTIMVFLGVSLSARSQFTIIPTGTNADITGLVLHNDTIIITGREFSVPGSPNFFAKTFDLGNSLLTFTPPGPIGYRNFDFQIVQNTYYILSIQSNPYEHNKVLKSSDYGNSWIELYDTAGLFLTLTMLDTTFGIMTGTFGAYAMTQDSDTNWMMQDSLYSSITASAIYGDSTILMMTVGGVAYLSEDRGQNWNWVTGISHIFRKIQFINKDTIYAISQQGSNKSYFYYSFDGGYSWSWTRVGKSSPTSYYGLMYDMYFDSPTHGYLVGDLYGTSIISETNDYGQTWTPWVAPFNNKLLSLLQVNDSIAFIGGSNGLLLKWDKTIPLTSVLSIDDISSSENQTLIFPNPSNEYFTVQLSEKSFSFEITITNMMGGTVLQERISGNSATIPISKYPSGVYIITVTENNQKIVRKLIIQH
ncbi:MAG: T9SS type A sorting domain-containing protein [candidate division WOR-3 bacterium]